MADLPEAARIFAMKQHAGARRRWTGEPYISHPARVVGLLEAFGINNPDIIAAAWLHDVVEDCGVTVDTIAKRFGVVTALLVEELTKPCEPFTAAAQTIKVADIADNCRNIGIVAPPAKALDYLWVKEQQLARMTKAQDDLRAFTTARAAANVLLAEGWRLIGRTI